VHAADLPDSDLLPEPLDEASVVAGPADVRLLPLVESQTLAVGLWQHGPGTSTDVEADEIFVVLRGRATIEIEDGPTLDVGPGDVVALTAGARTVWTVHETLRKVYVIRP